MARLFITPQAKIDLGDIWSYIAQDNPAAADELLGQIDTAFGLIAATPDIGFRLDMIRPGIRCKPVKRNYLIFYDHREETVRILRILHAARNYEDML
ncbi:Plasmid stabilization system protein [Symmachiella macrocystis]|uniref:Plasmid stabilization system protein n=1 Tax=Symmachiella macrocystis TaxID=2527985 RepID=A0A5C6BCN2_9PLAN|nr:type II toxin-antitoxin system RelE/ParE family toxin [Symmachiella macrocystis]TWU09367.1 Plasmid stabilization system protein [Symmachiella macrocystis]